LNASYINWKWNYEKALLLAKKEDKNLMVFLRKKDCINCQRMLRDTLINHNYIDKINDKYISVIVTYEEKNDYPVEMFYTLEFPSLFFVNSKDESFIIKPKSGFISSKKFIDFSSSIF
jgi:thioredoxin-related protein